MLLKSGTLFVMNLLVATLLIILSGCASFQGGTLPSRSQPDIVTTSQLESIGFDAKFYTHSDYSPNLSPLFREKVRHNLFKSALFGDVTGGCSSESACLEFTMNYNGESYSRLLTFLSGITLTILPASARDDYTMTVKLKQGGELIRTYEYHDYIRMWVQLFMIFFPGDSRGEARDTVQDNMIWNFIYDFQKDGLKGNSPIMINTRAVQ